MKRPKKRIAVAVVILAAIAAAVAGFWPREEPHVVRLDRVKRLPELKAVVNGSGEIRTENSVDIQAEIAGVIVELPVREGDRVSREQILLRIDPFQTEADVQATRAQLAALEAEAAAQNFQIASSEASALRDEFLKKSAEVERRQAEANLARSQANYNRNQKLLAERIISDEQFEVIDTELLVQKVQVDACVAKIEQFEAQIKAALANLDFARTSREATLQRVEGARSNLRRMEDLLKKTTIRSTLDGVIVKLNVEAGERAVPGILSNPQATLMTIADFSVIEAELKVDETDIVAVKLGDPAKVIVDALPETALAGRVIEIGNSPILSSGGGGGMGGGASQEGKDFKVVVRIDDPPAALRPGMSCEADITTAVQHDLLVAPIQALTMREVRVDESGRHLPEPARCPASGSSSARGAPSASSPARVARRTSSRPWTKRAW